MNEISTEMDFSLLASDMQKFLHISSEVESNNEIPTMQSTLYCNASSSKLKLRNCAELEDIIVHKCPFCSTSFNSKELVARHSLRVHNKAVVILLQEGSTLQHLKCRFCVHKVMHRHQRLLLLHLEKKHALELVAFLNQMRIPPPGHPTKKKVISKDEFTSNVLSKGSISMSSFSKEIGVASNPPIKPKITANEDITDVFGEISFYESKPCEDSESGPPSHCLQSVMAQSQQQFCAKRKLVLDGTATCKSIRASAMKENVPPIESLSTTLARSGWKCSTGNHFACGRCKESFPCNALLLDHVSVRHRGPLRLLQPLFTCGLCSASFYKNSFLVRHSYQHHTPR